MQKDDVVIATPCGADWNAMAPRGRKRLCGSCQTLVHDLSGLDEEEAQELLASTSESLCVRYLYDEQGRIWFRRDLAAVTPAIIPEHRLKRGARAALAVSALLAAPLLIQACGGNPGKNRYPTPPDNADAGSAGGQSATDPASSNDLNPAPNNDPNAAPTDLSNR